MTTIIKQTIKVGRYDMNKTFPSGCEIEDYAMGRQIRFIIPITWSQRGSYRRFYNLRRKFALKQTKYLIRRDYTDHTGFGLQVTCFLK